MNDKILVKLKKKVKNSYPYIKKSEKRQMKRFRKGKKVYYVLNKGIFVKLKE